jgi:hypothetical protein
MLAAVIDAMPQPQLIKGILPLTFLHAEHGKPRSKKALGNDFAGWAKQAGLLSEVQRYAEAANKKRLAKSGAAQMQRGAGQSAEANHRPAGGSSQGWIRRGTPVLSTMS